MVAEEKPLRETQRKEREGIVVSTKMDKTVVVAVIDGCATGGTARRCSARATSTRTTRAMTPTRETASGSPRRVRCRG
jgi:hypothetical protein